MKISIKTTEQREFNDVTHYAFLNGAICYGVHHHTKGKSSLLIEYLKKYRPSLTLHGYANDHAVTLLCSTLCKMTIEDRKDLLHFILFDSEYSAEFDANLVNAHGLPALYYAVTLDNADIIKLLLSAGADIQKTMQSLRDLKPATIRLNPRSDAVKDLLKETLYSQAFGQ